MNQSEIENAYFNLPGGLVGKHRFQNNFANVFSKSDVDYFFKHHPVVSRKYGARNPFKKEQHTAKAQFPFHRVHVDMFYIGKSPLFGLLFADTYSRYVMVELVHNQTTSALISAIHNFLRRMKTVQPRTEENQVILFSDGGGALKSKALANWLNMHGLRHFILSQSKSKAFLAEIYIRYFKQRLSLLLEQDKVQGKSAKPWPDYITKIESLMNKTPSDKLNGYSPLEACQNGPAYRADLLANAKTKSVNELLEGLATSLKYSDLKPGDLVRLRLRTWASFMAKPSLSFHIGTEVFKIDRLKAPNRTDLDRWPSYKLVDGSGVPIKCKYSQH